jgi:hypothetical protein
MGLTTQFAGLLHSSLVCCTWLSLPFIPILNVKVEWGFTHPFQHIELLFILLKQNITFLSPTCPQGCREEGVIDGADE